MSSFVTARQLAFTVLGSVLATLLITTLGYRYIERSNHQRFATVDLSGIVAKHREKAVEALASPTTDASGKRAALESAARFGKKLDETLIATATECRCVLLVKESVVASNLPDLTVALMTKLEAR